MDLRSRAAAVAFILLLVLQVLSFRAHASDTDNVPKAQPSATFRKSFFIGHNVTPSTETLSAGVWTVGNYGVIFGLTNEIFLATSPWIWVSYNTANIHAKWSKALDENSRLGFFTSYFHSYNSTPLLTESTGSTILCNTKGPCPGTPPAQNGSNGPLATSPPGSITIRTITFSGLNRYQWENINLHGLYSYRFSPGAATYFNLMYSYYWNDDLAYSIRMDPGTDSIRGQVNATSLTELRFRDSNFYTGLEFGCLGVNYINPYLQLGLSLTYLSKNWNVQIGTSYTIQFDEIDKASGWSPGRYDNRPHFALSENQTYYYRYLQTAMHPEIQIQYFF